MQKRGQFYLLSAIVIIAIIIGFSAVSTYTKKTENIRVFDLGEELQIESANVLDYGTYPAPENQEYITSAGGLDKFLTEFVTDYAEYVGEEKDLSVIFGNPEESTATVVSYKEGEIGTIKDVSSSTTTSKLISIDPADIEAEEGENIVRVLFKDQEYEVELNSGENFFFVISEEIGSEVYIAKSDEIEGTSSELNVCESDNDCTDGRVCLGGTCRVPPSVCGDGSVDEDEGEQCDWGDNNGVKCSVDYGETCEYCNDDCKLRTITGGSCGDGTLNGGEQCDEGSSNGVVCTAPYGSSCTYCSEDCTTQTNTGGACGNGVKEGTEQCDSGSSNGIVCNPPYKGSCNYCSNTCTTKTKEGGFCGDDIKQNAYEECDDGSDNGDKCSPGNWGECDYCKSDCTDGECWKYWIFDSGCH